MHLYHSDFLKLYFVILIYSFLFGEKNIFNKFASTNIYRTYVFIINIIFYLPLIVGTGTLSASESLLELSEVELLELESLSKVDDFVFGAVSSIEVFENWVEEDVGIIGVDSAKSSLSDPIIGKLARVDG